MGQTSHEELLNVTLSKRTCKGHNALRTICQYRPHRIRALRRYLNNETRGYASGLYFEVSCSSAGRDDDYHQLRYSQSLLVSPDESWNSTTNYM
jgi:hypothetical protein